jgi:hypothetical protein
MRNIFGVVDKVLMMAFASLLMSAPAKYSGWFGVGAAMVAVDALVHAFLARTGVLHRLGHEHPYGPACYQQKGCADAIRSVAAHIDCRKYNPGFRAFSSERDAGVALPAFAIRHGSDREIGSAAPGILTRLDYC